MKKIFSFKNFLLPLLIIAACNINTVFAAEDTISMGGVVGNIHSGATIIARLMWAACIIVGIALSITALTQFQAHRRNPKLVPLTTPAVYLILALLTLAIPFAERIFGFKDSDEGNDQTIEMPDYTNIDQH